MTAKRRDNLPTMDAPAIYLIRVRGKLAPTNSERLAGMNISQGEGTEQESILVGRIPDQAALSGVLATLYEMHRPVVSVECLEVG